MDDATIYIPTYRRVGRQETWSRLSPYWRDRAFLVAVPDEADQLRATGANVLVCPVRGISPTRQWVLDQHDVDLLGERLFMMDDDLGFAVRRDDAPTKFLPLLPQDHEGFNAMMGSLVGLLSQAPLVGLANRSGANRDTSPVRVNVRLHDLLGFNVPLTRAEGVRIDRLRFMEDFDVALQFLTKGYPTLCLNTHVKDDKGGSNAAGGCSEYRDAAGQAAAAVALAQLFPGFVTITERPGWNGAMAGARTDVRVAWAKAYAHGREMRELLGQPQEELLL